VSLNLPLCALRVGATGWKQLHFEVANKFAGWPTDRFRLTPFDDNDRIPVPLPLHDSSAQGGAT